MAMKFDPTKEVTKNLKFKPLVDLGNLCLGVLEKVEVIMNEVPKFKPDGSESAFEYAGNTVPSLKWVFKNHLRKDDKDRADRYFTYIESLIVSRKNDGTLMGDKTLEDLYTQMWDRIKHIHDAFKNDPNYKPFVELPEIDEKAAVEVRIAHFTKFFKAIADGFNKGKGDKAIFVDGEGKGLPLLMKLVGNYPDNKWLTFPTFVNEGFIERYKPGVPPTIEVKPGEIIHLGSGQGKANKGSGEGSSEAIPQDIMDMLNKEK